MRLELLLFASLLVLPRLASQKVSFSNFYYGQLPHAGRPVLLADGITRADGTNYIVELWAPDFAAGLMNKVATTNLLTGSNAGIFSGGAQLVMSGGGQATLMIRVWDSNTGIDFDSATVRGSVSFENRTGGYGSPPSLPAELTSFPGLCLGNPVCSGTSNLVEFFDWNSPPVFAGTRPNTTARVLIRRLGSLDRVDTIHHVTRDGTAIAGTHYLTTEGTLTFGPGEAMKRFDVQIIPDSLDALRVELGVEIEPAAPETSTGVSQATVLLYDPRPRLRWVPWSFQPNPSGSPALEVRAFRRPYDIWPDFGRIEFSATLTSEVWQPATATSNAGFNDGPESGFRFWNATWPEGFYRSGF